MYVLKIGLPPTKCLWGNQNSTKFPLYIPIVDSRMREMNGKGQNIKINTYVSVSISMMMLDFFYFYRNENDLNVDKNWLNFVVHFI